MHHNPNLCYIKASNLFLSISYSCILVGLNLPHFKDFIDPSKACLPNVSIVKCNMNCNLNCQQTGLKLITILLNIM